MADITFVKNTWGYSAPGADLKPANLQKIDDALDAVTHKANRGSALLDADQLASTTPTEVGLSMLSAANKAAQQALIEGAGLNADTVSGYGIGVAGGTAYGSEDGNSPSIALKTGLSTIVFTSNAPGGYTSEAFIAFLKMYNATNGILTVYNIDVHKNAIFQKALSAGAWDTTWINLRDADTVSGYGIGVLPDITTNIDTLPLSVGFYRYNNIVTSGTLPHTGTANGVVWTLPLVDANNQAQLAFDYNTGKLYYRLKTTTWNGWWNFWDAYSDGNGGQPPAPKPRSATGAGNLAAFTSSANTAINFPADGQWVALYQYFNDSTGIIAGYAAVTYGAGGTQAAGAGGVNIKSTGWYWRITE